MLRRMFDTDNIVFRCIATFGYLWWLHILWLVCSLPIITLGASTTALCYSCMKLHNKEGDVTKNFFRSFKDNFRQSTIIFIILVVVGVFLIIDIFIIGRSTNSLAGNIVKYCAITFLIPYVLTVLYAFAVQARYINSVVDTIKYSFVLALRNIGSTFQIICIISVVFMLNSTIVLMNFITVSMGVGVIMYVLTIYYNRIFAKIL